MTERDDDRARALLPGLRAALDREDRGWRRVRAWPTAWRVVVAVATVFAVGAAVLVGAPRADLDSVPESRLHQVFAALAVAAWLSAAALLRPLHRSGPSRAVSAALATGMTLLPLALALAPAAHHEFAAHPESFAGVGADFWPRVLGCLLYGTVTGAPVAAALLLLDRGPRLSAGRVLLAAGCAATSGTLALHLHCPLESVAHRIAGHGGIALTLAALLAAIPLAARMRKSARTA